MEVDDVIHDLAAGDARSHRNVRQGKKMKENVTPTPVADVLLSDSDDDDEPEIVEDNFSSRARIPQRPTTSAIKPTKPTEFIDLTTEDDYENDKDVLNLDEDHFMGEPDVMIQDPEPDDDLPELVEIEPVSKKELAEDGRKIGNVHFKRGEYNQALAFYNKAIELVPDEASYYGNRAACYMMMKKYHAALVDTQQSLQIDPTYEKSHTRLMRVNLALGDVKACENALQKYDKPNSDIAGEKHKLQELIKHQKDIEIATTRKDHRLVLFLCDRILNIATGDMNMKIRKAYTLIKLGRHNEAGEIAAEVMTSSGQNIDAHIIRALCHYQLDNMDKSLSFFRGGLQFNPDAEEPKALYRKVKLIKEQRETATELYKQGKHDESKKIYLECINLVTQSDELKNVCVESKFYFNLSLIASKQRNYDEAVSFATKAIALNTSYYKAFVHRASVYLAKEMHDEAVRDYEAALKIDPTSRELRNDIQNAKMAAKRAKRKDYYKILDITKAATEDEIRKAYKKRALLHHPDRHACSTESVQKEQEKHFKDVGEAYEVLSDPKKRYRYDQGHDLMDVGSGGGGAYYDPYDANQLFNMFFSTGSGGIGGRGGGHSGPRYHQFPGRTGGGGGGGCSYSFNR